jgi:hypothetical protein
MVRVAADATRGGAAATVLAIAGGTLSTARGIGANRSALSVVTRTATSAPSGRPPSSDASGGSALGVGVACTAVYATVGGGAAEPVACAPMRDAPSPMAMARISAA